MDKKLVSAVVRKLGSRDYLRDVNYHGADGGFPGFTYTWETVEFYKRHKSQIVELLREYADDMGESISDVVSEFRCLADLPGKSDEIGRTLYGRIGKNDFMVANALAWFALEEVARFICDQ
jgi:hypothetical protein